MILDIDRLSPDEVLLIFRLIKSVGRLPKITYLLAYDREIAERIISECYPSEGPHYLEKIIQVGFNIPALLHSDLEKFFMNFLDKLWKESNLFREGKSQDDRYRCFRKIFNDIVAPQIRSPRDIICIINVLKVTWPAVKGEVEPVDFMTLEIIRVKQPSLYATIKANKEELTDIDCAEKSTATQEVSLSENLFLGKFQNEKRAKIKTILTRLFPRLGDA